MKDKVNSPSHYTSHPSGIECIEISRWYDFCIGNAIKYLWRAGLKSEEGYSDLDKQIEDLKKAIWYINDEIKTLEAKRVSSQKHEEEIILKETHEAEDLATSKPRKLHFNCLVYGGSFDPPHNGHLDLLETVVSKNLADKVIVIPAKVSPLKVFQAPKFDFYIRVKMVYAMIRSSKILSKALEDKRLEVSDIERSDDELNHSPSYTYNTLKRLKELNPKNDFAFLIGDDVAKDIKKFYKSEELLNEFACVVYPRKSNESDAQESLFYDDRLFILGKDYALNPVVCSSSEIRSILEEIEALEASNEANPDSFHYVKKLQLMQKLYPLVPEEVWRILAN